MNNILSRLGLGVILLAVTACTGENELSSPEENTMALREITISVTEPGTRTTIEYDGADVSHLVWNEGDEIGYVTDIAGDIWRTAKISHNNFTATIPQSATATNKLYVVYPADNVVGKKLGDVELSTLNPEVINLDNRFDGKRIPMISTMSVPSGGAASANFDIQSSVIRLSIDSLKHSTEVLQEVTLSANEPLTGSYRISGNGISVTDGSKSITMKVKTEKPDDSTLGELYKNDGYIYFVVNRKAYTGFTLTITTDCGTYSFPDGKIDVTTPERTLYRLDVALSEPDAPVPTGYVRVTSADQITTGDNVSYLIVCEEKDCLFAEFNSTNYHGGVPTTIVDGFIDPTLPEVDKCKLILTPGTGDNAGRYSIKNYGIRKKDYFVGCMPNFSSTPAKVAFRTADTVNNYWKFEIDNNGNLLLWANPTTYDNNALSGTVRLSYYGPDKCFANVASDASPANLIPIQLYKYEY